MGPLRLLFGLTLLMAGCGTSHAPASWLVFPLARHVSHDGLAVVSQKDRLAPQIKRLKAEGIRVSLFVDAHEADLLAASEIGADIVELHTGRFCDLPAGPERQREYDRIVSASAYAAGCGLEVHAGHGLSFETAGQVARIAEIVELNIGHFLMGAAMFTGLADAIAQMRQIMDAGRANR